MLRTFPKLLNCSILLKNQLFCSSIRTTIRKSTMSNRILRTALIQLKVGTDRCENLKNASKLITEASSKGVQLVALPECFNSPYGTKFFEEYSETIPDGPTSRMLSESAKTNGIYLVGGTFPERDPSSCDNKFYNTCTVWNPNGELIGKFRKIHLFDIDIPNSITFKESEVLNGGTDLTIFEINGTKIGLGVCYDLRFDELAKLYRIEGCELLIYPGAFNLTTGPIHWELLQRGRALDNQLFVCTISPARNDKGYRAWGHSQFTDPWGKVLKQAGYNEEILYCDLDFNECDKVRNQIPIFQQRRLDIYNTIKVRN